MNKTGRSVLELLYQCYDGGEDTERVRELSKRLNDSLEFLPFAKKAVILTAITEMCAEYQRDAFLDGLRIGAQLMLELTEKT